MMGSEEKKAERVARYIIAYLDACPTEGDYWWSYYWLQSELRVSDGPPTVLSELIRDLDSMAPRWQSWILTRVAQSAAPHLDDRARALLVRP